MTFSRFRFKYEIGISEIIALVALVVSALAVYFATSPRGANVVPGSGPVVYTVVKSKNSCDYVISIPAVFHNSGDTAVSLEQLTPRESVSTVIFTLDNEILGSESFTHSLFRSPTNIGPIPKTWLASILQSTPFEPSFNHIGDLIAPGDSYRFFIVLVVDVASQETIPSSVLVGFDAVFSNHQIHPVNAAISFDETLLQKCV